MLREFPVPPPLSALRDIPNVKSRVLEMEQIMEAERLNAVSNHIGDLKSREQELRRYL